MSLFRLAQLSSTALLIGATLLAGPARADDRAEARRLLEANQPAAALPIVQRIAAANPKDVTARFWLGVTLMDLRRDGEALATFEALAQEYPTLADPHNNIALILARGGRLEEARLALETALRNDPTHVAARRNLGEIHLRLAVQAFERAASQAPADGPLQRRLEAARGLLSPR